MCRLLLLGGVLLVALTSVALLAGASSGATADGVCTLSFACVGKSDNRLQR